jgi:hypothetical protein
VRIDRIPGFAICGCCAGRGPLVPCAQCGILTCRECGGGAGACRACRDDRARAEERERRMQRVAAGLRVAGVVACIGASGMAAVGAALLPDEELVGPTAAHMAIVARGEVRFVGDAVERWSTLHGAVCPSSLGELRREGLLLSAPVDPWGEPLVFGCVDGPRAYVVLSKGPDREAGTADDLMFAWP